MPERSRTRKPGIHTRRGTVFNYLVIPEENRMPLSQFLKIHKMRKRTFYILEGEYKVEKLSFTKKEKEAHLQGLKETVQDSWDRLEGKDPQERKSRQASQSWLKSRGGEINEALIQSCKEGNAQALRLYFQLTEQLVEKQEVKVGLTADEIARQHTENQQWLREHGFLEEARMG